MELLRERDIMQQNCRKNEHITLFEHLLGVCSITYKGKPIEETDNDTVKAVNTKKKWKMIGISANTKQAI